jgi:hypothetical protein
MSASLRCTVNPADHRIPHCRFLPVFPRKAQIR